MPEIKIQHVVSVSSEDKSFPAENLVKGDSFKKWKCLAGEKQAAVVFQFEKATEVRQIDIGNEGSAFVEVLVGKSSSLDCDYEVILASSSFMNPVESRSSQNPNRVRIFSSDQLSRAVLDQKWDRVKVICTQPFNKTVQYGLSFIKFHSSPASKNVTEDVASKNKQETTTETQIGGFKLKSDPEPSSTLIRAGSLFEKSKTNPDQPIIPITAMTGAAAIRAASKQAEQTAVSSASKDSPAASKEPVTSKEKPGGGRKESRTDGKKSFTEKSSNNVPPAKKPKADETTSEQPTASTSKVPFSQLMKGVVFALSGFQNPERANLRDKATEMGAVYKPDWGKGCTHLICAFTNTPKYDQVAGRGYIVKKSWITDCHAQKKLLPWREYRLGKAPSPAASGSDTDGDDDPPKKKKSNVAETKTAATGKGQNSKKEANENSNTAPGGDKHKEPEQPSAESQDTVKMESDEEWNPFEENKEGAESDCDTEEEIRRFEEKQTRTGKTSSETSKSKPSTSAKPSTSKSKGADNYDVSTDEETNSAGGKKSGAKSDDLPELPSFFSGKTFLLYGKLNDRRATVRYITAYDGQLADYMGDSVKYVITDSNWDETFDEALKENPDLIFVRSTWIQACHSAQAFLLPIKYSVAAP